MTRASPKPWPHCAELACSACDCRRAGRSLQRHPEQGVPHMSYRVLVTASRIAGTAIRRLEAFGATLEFLPDALSEDMLVAAAARAPLDAILMRNNPPIGTRLFAAAPGLRVIAKHGAGYDSVDLPAATAAGVPVLIATGAN